MAIPTISSVSPARGAPGGWAVLEITGTNFRQQSAPPEGVHPVPRRPPSVRVLFGTVPARIVRIASATRLVVTTPELAPGVYPITVANIDDLGAVEGPESVTVADAYTSARPDFAAVESPTITRVTVELIEMLRRQVYPEVTTVPHIDWDDAVGDTLRKLGIAKLPAVYLVGPDFRESMMYRRSSGPSSLYAPAPGETIESRRAYTVDLIFTIGVISDNRRQTLAMLNALMNFTIRSPWVVIPVDPDVPGGELVKYEIDVEADFRSDETPNDSSIGAASGQIAVIGIDVETLPGFVNDMTMTTHPEQTAEIEIETGGTG